MSTSMPAPESIASEETPDTFCIHPWTRLRVEPAGAKVCCVFRGGTIAKDGAPMPAADHSLDEIWNSDEMRQIRKDMVEGRKVAGCEECYQNEAFGGASMRTRDNKDWENGWLNEDFTSLETLKSQAVSADFRVRAPVSLEIDTGSLCNLKCRMCHGDVSSRIAADPVHSTWALDAFVGSPYHDETLVPRPPRTIRFPKTSFINDVDSYVDQVKRLYFIGGEPTLVKEIGDVLQKIIDSGRSSDIELALVSNGTVTTSWLDLTDKYKKLQLAISIDGFDKIYEYIRAPYKWDKLVENIQQFKKMPHVGVGASVTLQANNILNITDLLRYLDSIDVGFFCYPIHMPRHLSVWAMPPSIRRLGALRLREYGETTCLPQHREVVLGLANQVESAGDTCDPDLLRQFMVFTNDLDVSRAQSIHEADPELVKELAEGGFPWIHDTLHAGDRFPARA